MIAGPEGEQRHAGDAGVRADRLPAGDGIAGAIWACRSMRDTGFRRTIRSTMATPLPGVFIAGVIASGFDANKIFIENGRDHGDLIVAAPLLST